MLQKIILSGLGLVLIGLSRFAFNAVALNMFGETTAGRLNIGLSLAILVSLPVMSATVAATVRFVAKARGEGDEAQASAVFRLLLGVTVGMTALTAGSLAMFRGEVATLREISVSLVDQAVLVAVCYCLYQFFRNALYAVDRVGLYTRLELLAAVVFFTTLAWFALRGGREQLLLAFAAGYAAFAFAAAYAERARLRGPRRRVALGPIASFSMFAMIGSTASLGLREVAILIAPDVVDLASVAHLGLIVSLLTPLQFMPRMLRTVVFAQSAEQAGRGDRQALADSISEVSHWLLLLNLPLCICVVLLANPILTLVGGDPTVEHVRALRILTFAAGIEIVATPATNALPGVGSIRVPSWSAVAGLLAAFAIWFWTAESHGLSGLCYGLLASSAIKGGVPMLFAWRDLGLRLTRAPFVAAALAVVSVAAGYTIKVWNEPYLLLAIYVGLVLAIGHRSVGEVVALVQARRRRGG